MDSIRPISASTLTPTLAVVESAFPTDIGFRWALPAAADPVRYQPVLARTGLLQARQWVCGAACEGTVGLYAGPEEMARGFLLLNWICVAPGARGRGLGRRLLRFAIEQARTRAAHLLLYSSTEPHHAAADHLYLAEGFTRVLGPQLATSPHEFTWFHLALDASRPADGWQDALHRLAALDADPAVVRLAETCASAASAA